MTVTAFRLRPARPYAVLALGLVALLLGGCETSGPATAALQTDSAGVEVVHTPEATWAPDQVWRLSSEPTLSIGVEEGAAEEEFSRITHAFWLSDGRVAAVNFTNPPEIRIFTADGGHDRTAGGEGAGPGEFAAITFAAPGPGDTLLVHDLFNARVVYLDPEGEVVRTQPMPEVAGEPANRRFPRGLFSDGTLLVMENNMIPGATPGHRRATRTLLRVTDSGTLVDTVLAFPDMEYQAGETGPPVPVPFGLRSAWHLHQDRLYVAPGDAFQVDVHDADGTLLRSLRTDRERRPVPPELAREEEERQTQRGLPETPGAELYPAHGNGIRVGPDGHVWLEHFAAPGDSVTRWGVFDPDGVFLGDVEVPRNFQLMQVGRGEVLGVWMGAMDVPGLRVYAVGPDA
jgi:hypothetical protein